MVKYGPSSLDPVGTTLLPTQFLVLFPGITEMYLRKAHQVASFPTCVSIGNPQYNAMVPSMCCKHYPETDWKRHQCPWWKRPLWKWQTQCQPRLLPMDIFKPSAVRCQCNIYLHIDYYGIFFKKQKDLILSFKKHRMYILFGFIIAFWGYRQVKEMQTLCIFQLKSHRVGSQNHVYHIQCSSVCFVLNFLVN